MSTRRTRLSSPRIRLGSLAIGAILVMGVAGSDVTAARGKPPGKPRPGTTTTIATVPPSVSTTVPPSVPSGADVAVDASTPAKAAGTTPTLTTTAFSPPAHSKVLAFVSYDSVFGTGNNQTISGGGLSWTLARRVNPTSRPAGVSGGVEIWFADVGQAPGAISVTTTQSQAMQATLQVVVFTNAAPGVPLTVGASMSQTMPSITLNAASHSSVWAVSSDWAAKAGTPVYNAGTTSFANTLALTAASAQRAYVMRHSELTSSPGDVTMSVMAPSGQIANLAAIEIRQASTSTDEASTTTSATVPPTSPSSTTVAATTSTSTTVPRSTTTSTTVAPTSSTSTTVPRSTTTSTTVAPTTTSPTVPPTTQPPGSIQPLPWDGGPAYWSKFSKAASVGWTDPSFFPVGVWFESARNAAFLNSLGINTMVVVVNDGVNLTTVGQQTGMTFLLQPEDWTAAQIGTNPYVVGHVASDEIDMNSSNATSDQQSIVNGLRGRNDGRFVYSNYGKGVLGTFWSAGSMPALTQMVDVASDDLYWWTDPYQAPGENGPYFPIGQPIRDSANYGWTVDRMESFLDQAHLHPTWNFVELGHPFTQSSAPTITADEMEGAVWQSITSGARGLVFFNHSFGGSCQSQHVLSDCDPAMRDRVAAVTARIRSLAPVLNSQSYQWNGGAGMTTMLKRVNGSWFLFSSLAQLSSTGPKTLSVPVQSGTATVVGEGRTVPIVNGHIVDTFVSTNVMHVYQMS